MLIDECSVTSDMSECSVTCDMSEWQINRVLVYTICAVLLQYYTTTVYYTSTHCHPVIVHLRPFLAMHTIDIA